MRGRSCSQVKKRPSDYFTVAVKSSGDISVEPAILCVDKTIGQLTKVRTPRRLKKPSI